MIDFKITTRSEIPKLLRKAKRARDDSIVTAARDVRQAYRNALRRKTPRPVGQPIASPTTRARKSIIFSASRKNETAIIGPSHNVVGNSVGRHEHGMSYKGRRHDKRPTGLPVLKKIAPSLPKRWQGLIK